ncbi:MAG: serine/threonine-protein phosphatase, partial [Erysipelotrichaceae bacterium]|nr:serine/threonine-protein phosphatase [Erysipelotrichaceae bacterium]
KLNTHYDVYLICSDGLFGYVDEQYILNILVENEPVSNKGKKLMQLALAAGGYDNITEILIQMEKGAQDE